MKGGLNPLLSGSVFLTGADRAEQGNNPKDRVSIPSLAGQFF